MLVLNGLSVALMGIEGSEVYLVLDSGPCLVKVVVVGAVGAVIEVIAEDAAVLVVEEEEDAEAVAAMRTNRSGAIVAHAAEAVVPAEVDEALEAACTFPSHMY